MEKSTRRILRLTGALMALALVVLALQPVHADPHPGQSVNVAIIGSPGVINGGFLPTTGPIGELGDFNFTNLVPGAVNAANLAAYDTVVLNVASPEMGCTTATLSDSAKADLVAFVYGGNKLIIYDSECAPGVGVDYSWLPYPFTTSNPGALGATGVLTIVEENTLSTSVPADVHFIDAPALGPHTDAVGDMNVMVTLDPNWCLDMSGTNVLGVTGPVHTYARYGTVGSVGLFIYNGLDVDYMGFEPSPPAPNGLRKIWVQEVTATVTDLLGQPVAAVLVNFEVTNGPNAGEVSDPCECEANHDCTTDTNGEVSWMYTSDGQLGTDTIEACFTDEAGNERCAEATKEWVDRTPPEVGCLETVNPHGKNVPPAGYTTLPGAKGGQNEDGFYELTAVDDVDPNPKIYLVDTGSGTVFGPFASGTKIKYTEAKGATPTQKKIGSGQGQAGAVDWHITGNGDAAVYAVDASGNQSSSVSCLVPPPPK